ncbi:hypothetical protein Tco_0516545 [Tanacetum coccineum]
MFPNITGINNAPSSSYILNWSVCRWHKKRTNGLIKIRRSYNTKFLNNIALLVECDEMEKINNFQQEPDETLYQAWEHFKELFMKCPQHYLTKTQEVILFYNGLDVPTRQILDSRGAVPTKAAADAKKAIQEMADYS